MAAWIPPARPPPWIRLANDQLPKRRDNQGPTHGQVFTTDGALLHEGRRIRSQERPALIQDLKLTTTQERNARSLLSHVEAHVAADMRRLDSGLPRDVVLLINNVVCPGRLSCRALLPSVLPPGHRLIVYERGSDGRVRPQPRIFIGTGERIDK